MDVRSHNSKAWNRLVEAEDRWTKPVSSETIEKAKNGEWEIVLTPTRPVPKEWFPPLQGLKVLCLASGGGQQGPVLAAAGANVTVLDNSEKQLLQDQQVASREGLTIATVLGDMTNLKDFADETFDFIVHPVSNLFVENVLSVWREAYRVLKNEGTMIAGFTNPIVYLFDLEQEEKGILDIRYSIPYSDVKDLPQEMLDEYIKQGKPIEFGHTLEDQIKGQIDAGFVITGFYEDHYGGSSLLDKYINTFMATKALKRV